MINKLQSVAKKDIDILKKGFIDIRSDFSKLEKNLKQEMSENTNKVLKSNDDLIKELKDFRDEQAASFDNYKRLDSKVERHENYLEKADTKLKIGFKPA